MLNQKQGGSPPGYDQRVVDQAVRFMYSHIRGVSFLQVFFPVSIAWMFWNNVSQVQILGWTAGVIAVYAARIILVRQFDKLDPETQGLTRWAHYFTVTAIVSGFFWGGAGVLFYTPESVNLQVLLYTLIVGVAAGSLIVNCYWLPSFYAYSIPSVGLVAANLLVLAELPGKLLGFLLVLYMLIITQVARRTHDTLYQSIQLQYENLELVEELKLQKERAETANRAKTRFLASANHDLRQPVHALSLMTYAAKDELTSPRGKKLYESMTSTVSSLGQLLESLLDLSRLDAGAMSVQRENVNLKPLGAQLITEFLPMAQRKNLRIGLGPFDFSVYTDIALVERILRNLVGNAIRYTNSGGVLVGCRRRGENVVIEVWDTGIGIDGEDSEKVFTEFYQGNNPDHDRTQGLGLGLSICRRIAVLLGHDFQYKSRPGRGSVFRLTLPLSKQVILAQPRQASHYADHKNTLCEKTILVIDDERIVRDALKQVLCDWGARVLLAASGKEAIAIIRDKLDGKAPDAIICDYRLQGRETGLDAIDEIRRVLGDQAAATLILTGDTAPDQVKTFEKSAIDVIHKPVHPDELHGYLGRLLKAT
ncbi:MAG: hybrid sensor histidine kinase/response regulator [Gammaproteobacteria bacterium]|nr:hybrid sensor histidine kinase/response regulator [Gammaproteobacteria bacterium]